VRSDDPPRLVRVPKGPNLEVLVPHTPIEAAGFHDEQLSLLQPLLAEHLEASGATDCIAWFYTPMALPLISRISPRVVVYDCMDELSAFHNAPRQLRQRESALMAMAAHVFTGGPSLYEARRGQHPHVHCLPSAVDAAHFNPAGLADDAEAAEARALQDGLPQPRLGFFGVIDERMDLALVDAVAAARPQWQLVMAGPVVKIDPATLPRRANIHWLGMQPYARLPHLLKGWDVALMPFALNEATRFISPTKTLEYMAGGKPVVSTAVRDVVDLHSDTVFVGEGTAGFIAACDRALAEAPFERARRAAAMAVTVSRSSWDQVAGTMARLIDEALAEQGGGAPRAWLDVAAPRPEAAPADSAVARSPAPASRFHGARQVRHLIIGAGPTGLAAALELGGPAGSGGSANTLLVEREDRVGGWCRSVEQGGFTFDHAGHIMFSNDAHVLDLYQRLLGDNLHWQNREAWVWTDGVYTRYPFQGSLYGLPPKVLTECLVGAIEARFGPLAAGAAGAQALPVAPPANFEEFILRVWGEGIARHFALPYNRKLWAVPLTEMETSWLGGRVPLPDLKQMIEGAVEPALAPMGPNARFGYPLRGGFQALMNGFLPLLNCDLALKSQVLRVSPASRTVRLDDGRLIHYGVLVSTMPLPRLVEACGDEAPQAVREAAAGLRHVAVRCVNLGVGLAPGQDRLTEKHWVYYAGDTVFHRIFVQGNASPHNSPPGTCGLTCEITHAPGKPLPCEGEALIQRAIDDCRRVGMIGPDNPVLVANQVDMPAAYVVYDHQRAANVRVIRDWFSQHGIVLAGRYAEWEYYNSDHAFLAGRKAAAEVRRRLAEGEGGGESTVAAAIGASATVA
jgi:protoporphyrinogen oxidase